MPVARTPTPAATPVARKPTPPAATSVAAAVPVRAAPPRSAEDFLEPPGIPRIFLYIAVAVVLFCAALTITVFVARPRHRSTTTSAQGDTVVARPVDDASSGSSAIEDRPAASSPDAATAGGTGSEGEVAYPATPTASAAEFLLVIETTPPGANVTVNGRFAGASPLEIKVAPFGSYDLRFDKTGFRSTTRKISAPAGKPPPLMVPLEKLPHH